MRKEYSLATENVRIVFEFQQDRFTHSIFVRENGDWKKILCSRESGSDESWPASPPLQEIHEHEPGASLLAVGGAGTSHWSASYEIKPDQSIGFDIACRLSQKYEFLGSNYLMTAPPVGWQIRPEAETLLSIDADLCKITPAPTKIELPTTIRWKYGVIATEGSRTP